MRSTKEQWQALIQAQTTSGLLATEFCKQHDLNDKYFSLRKQQLRQPPPEPTFVPFVKFVRENDKADSEVLTLNHGHCTIQFKRAPAAAWLAELVKALS